MGPAVCLWRALSGARRAPTTNLRTWGLLHPPLPLAWDVSSSQTCAAWNADEGIYLLVSADKLRLVGAVHSMHCVAFDKYVQLNSGNPKNELAVCMPVAARPDMPLAGQASYSDYILYIIVSFSSHALGKKYVCFTCTVTASHSVSNTPTLVCCWITRTACGQFILSTLTVHVFMCS